VVLLPSPMEGVVSMSFWQGKRVFITGHSGFKGSWLSLWLVRLGAMVTGYSLHEENNNRPRAGSCITGIASVAGNILDYAALCEAMAAADPEIVFHLAAQPLVRESYTDPVATFAVNVTGTAAVLEAVRRCTRVRAVVNVTSDKCYENREWTWPYRETDRLGGHDPYSASKACAELVSASYRQSFLSASGIALSTVRSGNVIGGGDWSKDRLVPDLAGSLLEGKPALIRNPSSVRPWQHVLEPLHGYMLVAEHMWKKGVLAGEAWNFGPDAAGSVTVGELANELMSYWSDGQPEDAQESGGAGSNLGLSEAVQEKAAPHEASLLTLDSSKARAELGWRPLLSIREAIRWTADWYKAYGAGQDVRSVSLRQIDEYERRMS
jgi:CDP-glucose 4,6-dehydratase